MSKSKRSRDRRRGGHGGGRRRVGPVVWEESDCPGCGGEDHDPRRTLDAALSIAAEFPGDIDPLGVESLIAELLTPGGIEDFGFTQLFGASAVLVLEARATPAAVGLLRGIGRLTTGELSWAAGAAADRLEAAGTAASRWCSRVVAPLRALEFTRSAAGHLAVLMVSFERGDAIHGFLVSVDLREGGVADRILPLRGDESGVDRQLAGVGLPGVTQRLSREEFRRELESALDRRARRDRADRHRDIDPVMGEEFDDPSYAIAATILRAHMRASVAEVEIADVGRG